VAAPKKPFDHKSVVCYYCDKKGNMKRKCYKRKADEAKGRNKPGGGRRDGGHGGGPQAGVAMAYTASAGLPGCRKAHGSTSGSSTWVLDSKATKHMAAGDKGFTVQAAWSGAKVTLANGNKVPIKGNGRFSMDVGKGNTKARTVLTEAMLVPEVTRNLLLFRVVDRNVGAVVFVGDACYTLSDGDTVRRRFCRSVDFGDFLAISWRHRRVVGRQEVAKGAPAQRRRAYQRSTLPYNYTTALRIRPLAIFSC